MQVVRKVQRCGAWLFGISAWVAASALLAQQPEGREKPYICADDPAVSNRSQALEVEHAVARIPAKHSLSDSEIMLAQAVEADFEPEAVAEPRSRDAAAPRLLTQRPVLRATGRRHVEHDEAYLDDFGDEESWEEEDAEEYSDDVEEIISPRRSGRPSEAEREFAARDSDAESQTSSRARTRRDRDDYEQDERADDERAAPHVADWADDEESLDLPSVRLTRTQQEMIVDEYYGSEYEVLQDGAVPPGTTPPPGIAAPMNAPKESNSAAPPRRATAEPMTLEGEEEYDLKPNLWADLGGYCGNCFGCGLYGGVELTFLAPSGEPEHTVTLTDLVSGQTATASADPGIGAGVRTWIGLQQCGWGIVFRHWRFENDETEVEPDSPDFHGGPPILVNSYHLEADVIDLELTQRFCCGCWTLDTSLGGRYVDLERASLVSGFANIASTDSHTFTELTGSAFGSNKLEGPGFTWSIRGTSPIFCSPCWNMYWGYRGSLVWADCYGAAALTEGTAVANAPIGAIIAHSRDKAQASTTEDCDDVWINELQFGLEYRHCMSCIPATCFIRAGIEYQNWQTGDFGARSNSFAFVQGGPPAFGGRVDASANAHDGDLDLFGLTLGVGVTY